MNGLTVALTAAEWQRHHDELLEFLASRTGEPAVERRIAELRTTLALAVPAIGNDLRSGAVGLGSRVTVRWPDGVEETYRMVEPEAVVSREGLISYRSPVGQAVFGRRTGVRVGVATPAGPEPIEIMAVEAPPGENVQTRAPVAAARQDPGNGGSEAQRAGA